MDLNEIGRLAKAAQPSLQKADSDAKNQVLHRAAELLVEQSDFLLKENEKDMEAGRQNGMPEGLLDRLLLTEERVKQMAEGLYQLEQLEDPIGEVLSMKKRPNGLLIGQKRVPLGVVGIIYEARPNVTVDAAALCLKSGNPVILRSIRHNVNKHLCLVFLCQRLVILDLSTLYADLCQCADDHVLCFCFCFNGKTIPLHIL